MIKNRKISEGRGVKRVRRRHLRLVHHLKILSDQENMLGLPLSPQKDGQRQKGQIVMTPPKVPGQIPFLSIHHAPPPATSALPHLFDGYYSTWTLFSEIIEVYKAGWSKIGYEIGGLPN